MKILKRGKFFFISIFLAIVTTLFFLYQKQIIEYAHQNCRKFLNQINFTLQKIEYDHEVRYCLDFASANLFLSELDRPIFYIDIDKIETVFKHIDCVENYKITRVLPNKIKITIKEKKPIAIWQDSKDNFFYITDNGNIITIKNPEFVEHFIIFTGRNAYKNAEEILAIMQYDDEIAKKITSISYISQRRWDINLANNIKIMLPEKNPEIAWKKFVEIDKNNKLSEKPNKRYDLRIENKLIVGNN